MSATPGTRSRCPPGVLLLVFVLAALVGGQGSSAFPLLDVDEPRFAQTSRTMLETGDWLVPRLGGNVRYDKPALIYWLQALSFACLGVGPGAARLPSALALGVAAMLTALLAFRRTGRTATAWLAGAVLATCVQAQIMAHGATADALLLACTTLSITGMVLRAEGAAGPGGWLMVWAGLGLGLLAKGPVALVPIAAVALAVARGGRAWRGLMASRVAGLLLALAIPLAWFVPVNLATDWGFVSQGLGHHVLERSVRPFEGHGGFGPQWLLFYPAALLVMFLPWSVLLPGTLRDWWQRRHAEPLWFRIGAFWTGGVLVVFTLVTSKLPHYVLPIYPFLAVEVARHLDRAHAAARPAAGRILLALGACLPAALLVVLASQELLDLWLQAAGTGLALLGMGVGGFLLLRRGRLRACGGYLALAMTLVVGTLTVDALPAMWTPRFLSTALTEQLDRLVRDDEEVFFLDVDLPSVAFRHRRPIRWPRRDVIRESADQALDFLAAGRGWIVTRVDRRAGLLERARQRAQPNLAERIQAASHQIRALDPTRGRVLELVLIR